MYQKPTQLKKLEGNLGKRPLPKDEPEPKIEHQDPPDDLDPDAVEFWHEMLPKLLTNKIMSEIDYWAFGNLCTLRARIRQIREEIIKEGLIDGLYTKAEVFDTEGNVIEIKYKKHPIAMLEQDYYQQYRMYASEFGMTPRGRAGVSKYESEPEKGDGII